MEHRGLCRVEQVHEPLNLLSKQEINGIMLVAYILGARNCSSYQASGPRSCYDLYPTPAEDVEYSGVEGRT